MPHAMWIILLFVLGACVGSFLNVVVYRLPRVVIPEGASLASEAWLTLRGLSTPPSHCPRCNTLLAWRDNVPIFGWLFLRGRCRYCHEPISIRYPTIEFVTGLLFAGTYVLMFLFDLGPCAPTVTVLNRFGVATTTPGGLSFARDGWLLALYLPLLACLLTASLIDAELFIIPLWIPWLMCLIGFAGHAAGDEIGLPGAIVPATSGVALLTIGATAGLILSLVALQLGWLRRSFAEGEPMLQSERDAIAAGTLKPDDAQMPLRDYAPGEIRREMMREVLFCLPILLLGAIGYVLALRSHDLGNFGEDVRLVPGLNGLLGSLLGAFVGAGWVWGTRILGSIAFGREAMGMGDVHLMFGVGAILGPGAASVAFFLAPLPGLLINLYVLFVDPKRAVPFGPYLSLGSLLAIFVYCKIDALLGGGVQGLATIVNGWLGA